MATSPPVEVVALERRRPDAFSGRELNGVGGGRASDGATLFGRNLQHQRADVLDVEEGFQVDHVAVSCERPVLPIRQPRSICDLVALAFGAHDFLRALP